MRTACLALALIGIAQPLLAEERTAANAFAFIRNMVTDGSWDGQGKFCHSYSRKCYTVSGNQIIGLTTNDQSSFCQLSFKMAVEAPESRDTRMVDLTKNFTINSSGISLVFRGPTVTGDGKIEPDWTINGPSIEAAAQVGKALQFIYEKCHQPSIWQTGG